jgi:hypothetical protein
MRTQPDFVSASRAWRHLAVRHTCHLCGRPRWSRMLRHAAPSAARSQNTCACTDSCDRDCANSFQACGHCLASRVPVPAGINRLGQCCSPIVEHVRPRMQEAGRWFQKSHPGGDHPADARSHGVRSLTAAAAHCSCAYSVRHVALCSQFRTHEHQCIAQLFP